MLLVLMGVSTWLQFFIITDLSGLPLNGVWLFGEALSSRMNPGFHCTGQIADSVYGMVWVSGLLTSTMEWPMVGSWYGQWAQVHSIGGILNAQWYHDKILRPFVVPFIYDHQLMMQHDNTWRHAARIWTQSPEDENIPVSTWPALLSRHATHWAYLGCSGLSVYNRLFHFLPISSNFAQPLKRSGPTSHRPQSTTWSTLCQGNALHCVREKVVTPHTNWFSITFYWNVVGWHWISFKLHPLSYGERLVPKWFKCFLKVHK